MESTFMDYQYPDKSFIRVNSAGMFCLKAFDSDMQVIQTMEQLFLPWYIKRY